MFDFARCLNSQSVGSSKIAIPVNLHIRMTNKMNARIVSIFVENNGFRISHRQS